MNNEIKNNVALILTIIYIVVETENKIANINVDKIVLICVLLCHECHNVHEYSCAVYAEHKHICTMFNRCSTSLPINNNYHMATKSSIIMNQSIIINHLHE